MMRFFSLITIALLASTISAIPLLPISGFHQVSDNDAVDAKNLNVGVNVLSGHQGGSSPPPSEPAQPPPQSQGPSSGPQFSQVSDNDLVDAKNANIGINILKKRQSDEALYDYFIHHVWGPQQSKRKLAPALPALPVISQSSDNDLVDAKNSKVKIDALNNLHVRLLQGAPDDDQIGLQDLGNNANAVNDLFLRRGSILDTSDNDLVDLKNLNVNVNAANGLLQHRGSILDTTSDNDLVDLKNLAADVNVLNRDAIEEALSILRRANYPVDNMLRKRSTADMYQEVQGDYTCLCSKTLSPPKCNSPPHQLKPKHKPKHKPSVVPSSVVHHTKQFTLPVVRPTINAAVKTPVYSGITPVTTILPVSTVAPSVVSSVVSSVVPSVVPSPVIPAPVVECPPGWTHAAAETIMQSTDNDLIDIKNLKLDINILSKTGETQSSKKNVPASDQPRCTGDACCYKQSAAPVVKQSKDNDLLDLKNIHVGLNALNNLINL